MLRTDRGDEEGDDEWSEGVITDCKDPRGDDTIEIIIREGGKLVVRNRSDPVGDGC